MKWIETPEWRDEWFGGMTQVSGRGIDGKG